MNKPEDFFVAPAENHLSEDGLRCLLLFKLFSLSFPCLYLRLIIEVLLEYEQSINISRYHILGTGLIFLEMARTLK